MLNILTVEHLFGKEKGISAFKYFDLHQLLATFIAQLLIAIFDTNYFALTFILAVINFAALGYYMTMRI